MPEPLKPTVVFAPETINIAGTTRMIEVARALADRCECLFIGEGDEYAGLIPETGFEILRREGRAEICEGWDPFTATPGVR